MLAKDCIAALTKELETSQDPAVRNNITVVLCDLCVRYGSTFAYCWVSCDVIYLSGGQV